MATDTLLINKEKAFNKVIALRHKKEATPSKGKVIISLKSYDKLLCTLRRHDNFKAVSLTKAGKKVMR